MDGGAHVGPGAMIFGSVMAGTVAVVVAAVIG